MKEIARRDGRRRAIKRVRNFVKLMDSILDGKSSSSHRSK
jgi:hypothetical protein